MKLLRSIVLFVVLVYIAFTGKSFDGGDAVIAIVVVLMMVAAMFAVRRRAEKPIIPSLSLTEHQLEDSAARKEQ